MTEHGLNLDLNALNQQESDVIIKTLLATDKKAIITTNFRPFEAVLIHQVVQVRPDIPVVWMDSGYATKETYEFADKLTKQLNLNLKIYHPKISRAHFEAINGSELPIIDTPEHDVFTNLVKLEPFERALATEKPEIWFTALRKQDSALRAEMDKVSINSDGLIKAAPLLDWNNKQMWQYELDHDLPDNDNYYDPTKGDAHRECGLHLKH
ncbi:phosphoadenosine phosphosulfate reductase family protein [Lactococcus insecticola]|uniref:Phosphoadenosine phosphosulfate reductase n=1 Tax=Pseudolactococcus insecticola TaxID=2709158 RepID=A0A6A0B438_9LACT|nr:phosphoadenosine phosphosulfate reductase family protein [Lactococcus insecticola]GFH39922.1 phosphoadenosine phosphosulfate reductase [Lactococcus insecticola]